MFSSGRGALSTLTANTPASWGSIQTQFLAFLPGVHRPAAGREGVVTETLTIDAEESGSVPLDPGITEQFLGPRVRVLWNLLSAKMLEALEPFGLKTGGFSTLALIAANPGCSQTELAKALGMDKSAVVAVIDDLEQRGLARRVRSAEDRRRHALEATDAAGPLIDQMHKAVSAVGRPIRTALSPEEYRLLLSLLERSHKALAGE
jgi:DNA-binding MarR family transcriptional regulator